ncbi:hypothetical protein [Streptomyces sp. NPDC058657]|uniref:hypothetical protein n=1 Tax=unclassified Streptomyces TaxID=2593676 RepID=UPI0036697019
MLTMNRDITFTVGPEVKAADAMTRAVAFVRRTLPMVLKGAADSDAITRSVLEVVTELVDITARHRHSADILGRVAFDGAHATISVGEMRGALPAPEEEPGLYLVGRLVDDLGQHQEDGGGYITWAAVPVSPSCW